MHPGHKGILATAAMMGAGSYAVRRWSRTGRWGFRGAPRPLSVRSVVTHPLTFGTVAGVSNGLLATARNKPVSLLATLVTAGVIGVSEAVLAGDKSRMLQVGIYSMLGSMLGLAPFTRFDARERALVERSSVPSPISA